jgi:hypothetical protein
MGLPLFLALVTVARHDRAKLLNTHHSRHTAKEVGISAVAAALSRHIESLVATATKSSSPLLDAHASPFLATGLEAVKQWAEIWKDYNHSLPIPISYLTNTYAEALSEVGVGGANMPPFPFLKESMPASYRAQKLWTPFDIFPLATSSARFDIPLIVLGYGKRWKGFNDKTEAMAGVVNALNQNQHIMFVDGTDVVFTNRLDVVSRVFSKSQSDMLFMTECNSWPRCLKTQYLEHGLVCPNASKTCYLNSGIYLGTAAALHKVLTLLPSYWDIDDQGASQQVLLHRKEMNLSISLDWHSEAFVSTHACFKQKLHGEKCGDAKYHPADHMKLYGDGTLAVW